MKSVSVPLELLEALHSHPDCPVEFIDHLRRAISPPAGNAFKRCTILKECSTSASATTAAAQHQNSNPGWPDPLESTLAKEIINNPASFDLAIRDLFDKLCREIQAGRYYRRFSGSEPMEFTANQPAPVAVVHTMKSIMEAVEASRCYTVLTSDQCHALAQSLNGVNK